MTKFGYHKTSLWDQVNELARKRAALLEATKDQSPSPAAVGAVAKRIGVSKPTLWRWEEGKVRPHRLFLHKWMVVIAELESEIGGSHGRNQD